LIPRFWNVAWRRCERPWGAIARRARRWSSILVCCWLARKLPRGMWARYCLLPVHGTCKGDVQRVCSHMTAGHRSVPLRYLTCRPLMR
jgi:hypothetical protein